MDARKKVAQCRKSFYGEELINLLPTQSRTNDSLLTFIKKGAQLHNVRYL